MRGPPDFPSFPTRRPCDHSPSSPRHLPLCHSDPLLSSGFSRVDPTFQESKRLGYKIHVSVSKNSLSSGRRRCFAFSRCPRVTLPPPQRSEERWHFFLVSSRRAIHFSPPAGRISPSLSPDVGPTSIGWDPWLYFFSWLCFLWDFY